MSHTDYKEKTKQNKTKKNPGPCIPASVAQVGTAAQI